MACENCLYILKLKEETEWLAGLAHRMMWGRQACEEYLVELGGSLEEARRRADKNILEKDNAYQERVAKRLRGVPCCEYRERRIVENKKALEGV